MLNLHETVVEQRSKKLNRRSSYTKVILLKYIIVKEIRVEKQKGNKSNEISDLSNGNRQKMDAKLSL